MCSRSLEFYSARSFVVHTICFNHSALLKGKCSPLSAARKSETLGTEDSKSYWLRKACIKKEKSCQLSYMRIEKDTQIRHHNNAKWTWGIFHVDPRFERPIIVYAVTVGAEEACFHQESDTHTHMFSTFTPCRHFWYQSSQTSKGLCFAPEF